MALSVAQSNCKEECLASTLAETQDALVLTQILLETSEQSLAKANAHIPLLEEKCVATDTKNQNLAKQLNEACKNL